MVQKGATESVKLVFGVRGTRFLYQKSSILKKIVYPFLILWKRASEIILPRGVCPQPSLAAPAGLWRLLSTFFFAAYYTKNTRDAP